MTRRTVHPCKALAARVGKLEDKEVSTGREVDGVTWTPLFTSYFMNCSDVGRSLVRRGADVGIGGRDGALLAEVATQRAMNPDPNNSSTNAAWAGILEGGRIDIDAPVAGKGSNRDVWRASRDPKLTKYSDIWARFERASVSTPLKPDEAEIDPDIPTPATGKTRPAESPVSKGVEKFASTYQKSGISGLIVEITGCYKWALQIAKPAGRRIAFENCAALDIVTRSFDAAFSSKMNFPPNEFFEAFKFDARINQIRDQNFEGMVWPVYRRNVEASAMLWFGYHAELVDAPRYAGASKTEWSTRPQYVACPMERVKRSVSRGARRQCGNRASLPTPIVSRQLAGAGGLLLWAARRVWLSDELAHLRSQLPSIAVLNREVMLPDA